MQVGSGFGTRSRVVFIIPGRRYVVKPLNPRKLKHRDRECVVLDIVERPHADKPEQVAKVRYADNNRVGYPDVGDLVPLDELRKGERLE